VHLFVDKTQPVSWNKAAFEQLVLPKRTKNIIKALVMVRRQSFKDSGSGVQIGLKGGHDDIIAGKGSGLIMLLHGGPGTGKTLTADEILRNKPHDMNEMPLYSVTCGDIGTNPDAVEKYLNSVLHLGKIWNCGQLTPPFSSWRLAIHSHSTYTVLLLDEADIFLEERTLQDLQRNSLVSGASNNLEWYPAAFKSRIQLALRYLPLDAPSRRKIWLNFINMLDGNDERIDVGDMKAHKDQLAGYELNGRQIRNALTTARQLAIFEQEILDWDRVKNTIEVSADFTRYIKEVHGHTDEEWSRDNNIR
ncbi:uncharacterized protein PODANS_4_5610, partial [Podospora anserina S mat+]